MWIGHRALGKNDDHNDNDDNNNFIIIIQYNEKLGLSVFLSGRRSLIMFQMRHVQNCSSSFSYDLLQRH